MSMATSFFYIYVMANSFLYIYIDTYIDIYIDIYELAERPVVLLNAIFPVEVEDPIELVDTKVVDPLVLQKQEVPVVSVIVVIIV